MKSSNPVMRSLADNQAKANPFASAQQPQQMTPFASTQAAQAGAMAAQGYPTEAPAGYGQATRAITFEDIVNRTAITLGVIVAFAIVNYMLSLGSPNLGMMLTLAGALGGFVVVLVNTFSKKPASAGIVLGYAALEGLFVGGISFMFANVVVAGANAGALIGQAVLATIGVFAGMLFVYRSGAIRVTPKFTRALFAATIAVVVLMLGNLVIGLFTGGVGMLREGGPIAIIFSLVCIGIAALSFLLDFDAADKLVRSGAPENLSWQVALGLAVTLVWLYIEILRLLAYFRE